MAKPKGKKKEQPKARAEGNSSRFADLRIQSAVLLVLGLILYANSFNNLYALDDGIVIQQNKYVQEGFRGIPRIFATDAYESFYAKMGATQQLSGGRYRPLSVATFAVEQQLLGSKEEVKVEHHVAYLRHVVNVVLYLLSIVLLLRLLARYVCPDSPQTAFLACLIFLIHPLHTEVVANVKSRDEILSFLFIVLTCLAVFRYRETRGRSQLVYGLLLYLMALLSKEYAITLLALIPLLLFVVSRETVANSIKAVFPFLGVAVLYICLRYSVVGLGSTQENLDVLNNPYKFATHAEAWATRLEILDRYLKLLFFPYPLSSDYSYKAIPYAHFSDGRVWLAIVLHLAMIGATIVLIVRRNVLAFALAFYLAHLFLVSNLVVDIGATMGERLVYHSSLGFALAIALLLGWALRRVESGKRKWQLTAVVSVMLVVPCAAIVVPRNAQWKNDATLFIADVKTVPESALVNGNAGKAYLDLSERPENKAEAAELTRKSIPLSEKAISIHKGYLNGYLNLGVAYAKLGDLEKAEGYWNTAEEIYPDHPYVRANFHWLGRVYSNKARAVRSENGTEAIRLLERATRVDPENADLWYNLGETCAGMKEFAQAKLALTRALQLKPGHAEAERALSALPPE